jgi:hypothetical protein
MHAMVYAVVAATLQLLQDVSFMFTYMQLLQDAYTFHVHTH